MACLAKDAIRPTIKTRKQANGITRYTAIVRMRRGGRDRSSGEQDFRVSNCGA
jgi:hypothetical protein